MKTNTAEKKTTDQMTKPQWTEDERTQPWIRSLEALAKGPSFARKARSRFHFDRAARALTCQCLDPIVTEGNRCAKCSGITSPVVVIGKGMGG